MSGVVNIIPAWVSADDWTLHGGGTKHDALEDISDSTYLSGAHSNMVGKPCRIKFEVPELPANARIDRVVPKVRLADTRNAAPRVRFYSRFRKGNKFLAEANLKAGGSTAKVDKAGPGAKTSPKKKPWEVDDFGTASTDTQLLVYTRKYKANETNGGSGEIYKVSLDVHYNEAPVATIIEPVQDQIFATMYPTIEWAYDDEENDEHSGSELKVFSNEQYGVAGFDPSTSESTFSIRTDKKGVDTVRVNDSIVQIPANAQEHDPVTGEAIPSTISKQALTRQVSIPLPTGLYRAYVRVYQAWRNKTEFPGDWVSVDFAIAGELPDPPTLTTDNSTQDDGYLQFTLTDNNTEHLPSMLILEKSLSQDQIRPAIADWATWSPLWEKTANVVLGTDKITMTIDAGHPNPKVTFIGPQPTIFRGLVVPPGIVKYRLQLTFKVLGTPPAGMDFRSNVAHYLDTFYADSADIEPLAGRYTVGQVTTLTMKAEGDWQALPDGTYGLLVTFEGVNPLTSAGSLAIEIYDWNLIFDNFTWLPVRNMFMRPTAEVGAFPVKDFEVPSNHEVWYRARSCYFIEGAGWAPMLSDPTTPQRVLMTNEKNYLKNPFSPGQIVHLRLEDNKIQREFSKQATTFRPLGAKYPIVVSDVDTAHAFSLSMIVFDDDLATLQSFQEQKTTLLLQTPHYFNYVQIVNTVKIDEYLGTDGVEGSPSRYQIDCVEVEVPDV